MKINLETLKPIAEKARKYLAFVPILLLIIAVVVIIRELSKIDFKLVFSGLAHVQASAIIGTIVCIIVSYSCASASDWLGVRHVGSKIPTRRICTTGMVARSFSNTIGVGMLSGGVIRFRYYSESGLTPLQIGRVIITYSIGCTLGLLTIGGFWFIISPQVIRHPYEFLFETSRPLGFILLIVPTLYAIWVFGWRRKFRIRGIVISPPRPNIAARHLPLAMLDWVAAGIALYFLIPESLGFGIGHVLSAFFLAIIVGHISGVPSAIGVFELSIIAFLGDRASLQNLTLALTLYRLIFYLCPFFLAIIFVAITYPGGIRGLFKKKEPS